MFQRDGRGSMYTRAVLFLSIMLKHLELQSSNCNPPLRWYLSKLSRVLICFRLLFSKQLDARTLSLKFVAKRRTCCYVVLPHMQSMISVTRVVNSCVGFNSTQFVVTRVLSTRASLSNSTQFVVVTQTFFSRFQKFCLRVLSHILLQSWCPITLQAQNLQLYLGQNFNPAYLMVTSENVRSVNETGLSALVRVHWLLMKETPLNISRKDQFHSLFAMMTWQVRKIT